MYQHSYTLCICILIKMFVSNYLNENIWNHSHRLFLLFDLLELPSLSLHSPGMGMSCMSCISASCVGVLFLTSSALSLRTSGLSVLVRTRVGSFNDLGNES